MADGAGFGEVAIRRGTGDNDVASLRMFMATLRKKIERDAASPQYIQTHVGIGYRMLRVKWR